MADLVTHGITGNDAAGVVVNVSGYQDNASSLHAYNWSHPELSDVEYLSKGVLMPCLALCGVIGNLLNLTILSWRCNKREVDVLERGALLGLIALAVSDLCFCVCIIPNLAYYENQIEFYEKNFHYYFELYKMYFRNVFIKVSTWLTVIIATARFVAICHPLKARIFTGLLTTKCAILITYITWFVLMTPLLWWREVIVHQERDHITLVMDIGYLIKTEVLNLALTYTWAILGYFIPVTILTFCNIRLIYALRRARRWRENSAHNNRSNNGRDANTRITSTLVALILMFLTLVTPSELLYFLEATQLLSSVPEAAIWCTNLLQAVNFGFHFVLYCAVNATFRRAIVTIFYTVFGKITMRTKHEELQFRRPNYLNPGPTSIGFKSVETNV